MGTTSTLQPRPRHGARLIQVALGGYFMAFGAGLVPGKDVRVLTQHLAEAPLDSLVAAALICPIALLVIMGRLYTPALIALIAALWLWRAPRRLPCRQISQIRHGSMPPYWRRWCSRCFLVSRDVRKRAPIPAWNPPHL